MISIKKVLILVTLTGFSSQSMQAMWKAAFEKKTFIKGLKALRHTALPLGVFLYQIKKNSDELNTLEKPSQEFEKWSHTLIKDLGFDDSKFTILIAPKEGNNAATDGQYLVVGK